MTPSLSSEKKVTDLGTVAIIAYRLPRWSQPSRVAISRMLNGLPAMHIGRCLYLTPYLKASRMSTYQGIIPNYSDLSQLLQDKGVRVSHMTHLQVIYPTNQEIILRAFKEAQEQKIERFALSCRQLKIAIKTGETNKEVSFGKLLSAYRHRYRVLKGLVYFLNKEMNMDFRLNLKRVYASLISCKSLYESGTISQMLPKQY